MDTTINRARASRNLTEDFAVPLIVVTGVVLGIITFLSIPSPLGFWTSVGFRNDAGEVVWITPIGSTEGGMYGPIVVQWGSALNQPPNRNLEIADGGTRGMAYDWDDQNLQFVLVRTGSGRIALLTIDETLWAERGYGRCCWSHAQDLYSIPPVSALPDAPAALLPTLDGQYVGYSP